MSSTHRQILALLRKTRRDKGVTLAQLKSRAHLKCSVVRVSRKLSGNQPSTALELAAMARALSLDVDITRESITVREAAGDSDASAAA